MSANATAISSYYTTQVEASDLNAGEQAYAKLCLAQWCAAEDMLTTAVTSSLSSYSISGRSVSRVTMDNAASAAAAARARFFEACHGFVTYVDISDAQEAILEATGA